ncbi:MAG TPA: universal stress protein [Gemmataceae bacterium]|nr:universal stress protein [Gemmataceae bacterium]
MFKNILLPVDMADKHGPALDAAAELAKQSGGEIVLLHVIEVIPGLSLEEERGFYGRLEKAAQGHLGKLGAHLKHLGVPWRAEIVYGNRGAEVVRFSAAAGVDLIVLTSPRIDPSNLGASWGSLSYKISYTCQCPVLLVK